MHFIFVLIALLAIAAIVYHFASAEVTKIETEVETEVKAVETDASKVVKKL